MAQPPLPPGDSPMDCVNCEKRFQLSARPVVLKCEHIFCSSCVARMRRHVQGNVYVTCCACNTETDVPSGRTVHLPTVEGIMATLMRESETPQAVAAREEQLSESAAINQAVLKLLDDNVEHAVTDNEMRDIALHLHQCIQPEAVQSNKPSEARLVWLLMLLSALLLRYVAIEQDARTALFRDIVELQKHESNTIHGLCFSILTTYYAELISYAPQ